MRRAVQEADRESGRADKRSFFKMARTELLHRQPGLLGSADFGAAREKSQRELLQRHPVDQPLVFANNADAGLAEQTAEEFGSKIGAVIIKNDRLARGSGDARVHRDDLTLPFRVQHVPVRFELVGVDQVFFVEYLAARAALEHEYILTFVVDVLMFFLPPLRLIDDFRQDQQRLYGIERLGGVKRRRWSRRALDE